MKYDIIIIGAGPAGYVAALRAGQIGKKVLVVDKKYIGGMCLNWGCIPTKTYLESAKLFQKIASGEEFGITGINKEQLFFDWSKVKMRAGKIVARLTRGIEFLFKKNGIEFIKGEAIITGANQIEVENRIIEAENIIIATGSKPYSEGYVKKWYLELEDLSQQETTPKELIVLGEGPVAVEIAQLFSMIGSKVTLVSDKDRLLPDLDDFFNDFLIRKFKKERIEVKFNTTIDLSAEIPLMNGTEIPVGLLINCRTRKAILPENRINLRLDNTGFIAVDEYFRTNYSNIFAVGDVNGKSKLAHAASRQGLNAVNMIAGIKHEQTSYQYPVNIYTIPEMAMIGLSEKELKEHGYDLRISEFSLASNGKALAEGETEGMVRLISEQKYGEILAVQIIAVNATDMISEAAALMKLEGTIYDLAEIIHAHPTISEVFMEAGLDAVDRSVNKEK